MKTIIDANTIDRVFDKDWPIHIGNRQLYLFVRYIIQSPRCIPFIFLDTHFYLYTFLPQYIFTVNSRII